MNSWIVLSARDHRAFRVSMLLIPDQMMWHPASARPCVRERPATTVQITCTCNRIFKNRCLSLRGGLEEFHNVPKNVRQVKEVDPDVTHCFTRHICRWNPDHAVANQPCQGTIAWMLTVQSAVSRLIQYRSIVQHNNLGVGLRCTSTSWSWP